jgi:hypothetical protein
LTQAAGKAEADVWAGKNMRAIIGDRPAFLEEMGITSCHHAPAFAWLRS